MKTSSAISAGLCAALLAATVTSSADDNRNRQKDDEIFVSGRALEGLAIAPVHLSLKGKNVALVGLGSYLVNAVGGCNDCHTHPSYLPGGDPFQGESPIINADQYLAGGRQFGPFTSANITPDQDGRPAGLTFEEFKFLIRTGHDPDDPSRILQVMPWPVYANMTSTDLRAIYEYLRAIPSRPDNPNPGP
ncbi:MAG TPA: hypothetical protein VFS52_05875 [Steroidobacteraceae bacterium]|jgi:hypothetical protein|nr:hypothetical protein [Steroidobacteraceae bacterium]